MYRNVYANKKDRTPIFREPIRQTDGVLLSQRKMFQLAWGPSPMSPSVHTHLMAVAIS